MKGKSNKNLNSSYSSKDEEFLLMARDAAIRRYLKYPNVISISAGIKYRKRKMTNELSIQFFVTKKISSKRQIIKPLPKFVYGRYKNGKINYRKKLLTDVIEVKSIKFATCGSGSRTNAGGNKGTITLFIRDKACADADNYYFVTCSHVVGELNISPSPIEDVESTCYSHNEPLARIVKNSVRRGLHVKYDIALCQLTNSAKQNIGHSQLANSDLLVTDEMVHLTGFLKIHRITPSLSVECKLGLSGHRLATVTSYSTSDIPISLPNGVEVSISNLYSLDLSDIQGGDSGGLVYKGNLAVGMIVAKSGNRRFAWFHPLEDAFKYLNSIDPITNIKCFL